VRSLSLSTHLRVVHLYTILAKLECRLVVKDDGSLDRRLVTDALESLTPLLELEGLVDDTLSLDLATIEIVDRGGELEGLGERSDDGDF